MIASEYISNQYVQDMSWFKKGAVYQSNSNLQLLFEPLAQLSVTVLKVLWDALCDSYYDMEVNYKIFLFKEMQEYKPPTAH